MAPGKSRWNKSNSFKPPFTQPIIASASDPLMPIGPENLKRAAAHTSESRSTLAPQQRPPASHTLENSSTLAPQRKPPSTHTSKSSSTLAPQREPSIPHTSRSSDHASQTEPTNFLNQERNTDSIFSNKGRGPTRGKGLASLNKTIGKKLPIDISLDLGRPVDRVQSAKLSSELGLIAREFMRVPICWKKLDKSDKQKAHARLDMRLSILNRQDEDVTRRIDDILKRRSKDCRYKWHQHFLKFDSVDDAIINKPRSCRDDDDWKNLCIYWSNPTVQERCAKNSYNRSMLKILHNQGSMAFVAVRHEIEQNELNGEECDRIELFKRTHYSTGKGWTTIEAEKKYDEMQALLDESSTSIDAMITTDEICDKVLGVRSSYIKGLGYGPKPKRTYTSNSRIQELEESLKASQTECNELKNFYIDLKAQVEQQASWIESLIAAGFRPPPPKQ